METTIKRWGNSLGFRIPKSFASQTGVCDGSKVDITLENNRLVITPIPNKLTLEEMLIKVTPENMHGEIDSGEPVGNEIW